MKISQYKERMEWARKLTVPACLYCTKRFNPLEPAISIYAPDIKRDVYFHASCYDIVTDQSKEAHKMFYSILIGDLDWTVGTFRIERLYPFRFFAPSRLKFRKEHPENEEVHP